MTAIRMLQATMEAAGESIYTADEAELKRQRCDEVKDEHTKEFCLKVQKS